MGDTKTIHPEHYGKGATEVIKIIDEQITPMPITPHQGFLVGNILKYLLRFPYKEGAGMEARDLRKARTYLDWLINTLDAGQPSKTT